MTLKRKKKREPLTKRSQTPKKSISTKLLVKRALKNGPKWKPSKGNVYLEDLDTASETNILVVDSDGKITKNTGAGDDMTFNVTGDSGTPEAVVDGNTVDIAGGTNITTAVSATDTVTVNLDNPIAGPIEIEQGASGGGTALQIDNNDIDQVALDIDAANTTAPAILVKASAIPRQMLLILMPRL